MFFWHTFFQNEPNTYPFDTGPSQIDAEKNQTPFGENPDFQRPKKPSLWKKNTFFRQFFNPRVLIEGGM